MISASSTAPGPEGRVSTSRRRPAKKREQDVRRFVKLLSTSRRRPAKKREQDAGRFVKSLPSLAVKSPQPHPRQGARVGGEQIDARGARAARRHHHALAQAELHLPRREVAAPLSAGADAETHADL